MEELDQIVAAAHQRLARVWSEREAWGATSIGELSRYIQQNSYPPRIRGTLRDAVTYLWVELLADTSLWRPDQSNDLFRLDFDGLAGGPGRLIDLGLMLDYELSDSWRIGGGYRTLEGGADTDDVYSFAWLHYATLDVRYRF